VEDRRVWGVKTSEGQYFAEKAVVLAAGAWNPFLLADLGDRFEIPIKPIKGQVLSLTADIMPMHHIVFARHRYVVPKPDGRFIVGATEDDTGFDDRVEVGGVAALTGALDDFGPRIRHMRWDTAWAGLRPMAPDGLPVLGVWPQWDGLFVAAGHFRNGILLSAVTADLVVDWAQNGTLPPEAFSLRRFKTSARNDSTP
jgi:glycine oxidase